MLHRALELEVDEYLDRHSDDRDENGHARVTRNGKARPRKVTIGSGTMEVTVPRIRDGRVDEDGERCRFTRDLSDRFSAAGSKSRLAPRHGGGSAQAEDLRSAYERAFLIDFDLV